MAWQPIETAPTGTLVLFCSMTADRASEWCYVDWIVDGRLCDDPRRPPPTHWMPLPPPPDASRPDVSRCDHDVTCRHCGTRWPGVRTSGRWRDG